MHSNGGGDARSGVGLRMRDPSSLRWFDLSPAAHSKGGPSFRRDTLDGAERMPAKTGRAAHVRLSSARLRPEALLVDVGPGSKRRAPGRTLETGRLESSACRSLNISPHVRRSQENSKDDRDFFRSVCGPSPGCSSCLSMEKRGKEPDGIHPIDLNLSFAEVRSASSPYFERSPPFNPPTTPCGINKSSKVHALWERKRSKFSTQEGAPLDKGKYLGKHAYCRETYSLPKLVSPSAWGGRDTELLEGRIDRYGSTPCKDSSISINKHTLCNWNTKDCGISFVSGCTSVRSDSHLTDTGASPAHFADAQPLSPHYHDVEKNSFFNQDNEDFGARPASPKKNGRLTWGQGLAKYEKEKTQKKYSGRKKPRDDHIIRAGSHEDVQTYLDWQSRLTESGSLSFLQSGCNGHEQDSCDSGVLISGGFERSFSPKGLTASDSSGFQSSISMQHSEGEPSPSAECSGDLPVLETSWQSPILHNVKKLLTSFAKDRLTLSIDVLAHHMEMVELEIDRLEKELAELCSYEVSEFLSMHDAVNSRVGVHASESSNTSISATGTQSAICKDSSALMIVSAENVAVVHHSDVHMQLQEASDCVESSAKTVDLCQSDMDIEEIAAAVADVDMPALQPSEQCEIGPSGPDLETTHTDLDFSVVESILLENSHTAEKSSSSLAHLKSSQMSAALEPSRLCSNPQQLDVWISNVASHSRKRKQIQRKVLEERALSKLVEKILAVKLMALRELWKQKQFENYCGMEGVGQSGMEEEGQSKIMMFKEGGDTEYLNHESLSEAGFDSDLKNTGPHTAKVLKILSYAEQSRSFLKLPAMLLGGEREAHEFKTNNGLVNHPMSAEQERKMLNPWSKEEKNLFLEKFSLFGKDFRRIASCLEHKTVADCVEFYYRNQKTEDFEKVHRRRQSEKAGRFQMEERRVEHGLFHLGSSSSMDSEHSEYHTSDLEGLSLVAAAAVAMSALSKNTYFGLGKGSMNPK